MITAAAEPASASASPVPEPDSGTAGEIATPPSPRSLSTAAATAYEQEIAGLTDLTLTDCRRSGMITRRSGNEEEEEEIEEMKREKERR